MIWLGLLSALLIVVGVRWTALRRHYRAIALAREIEADEWEIEAEECGCSGTIREHNLGGGRGCRLDVQGLLATRDKC